MEYFTNVYLGTIIFLGTLIFIFHSLKYNGSEFTLLIFFPGIVLGFLKEGVITIFTDIYRYNLSFDKIFSTPLIMGPFLPFCLYISFNLAEGLLNASLKKGEKIIRALLFSSVIMVALSYSIEFLNGTNHFIIWGENYKYRIWADIPFILPWSYGVIALSFLGLVSFINKFVKNLFPKLIISTLLIPYIIVIYLLFLYWGEKGVSFILSSPIINKVLDFFEIFSLT